MGITQTDEEIAPVIPLTRGLASVVDEADYPALTQLRWYTTSHGAAASGRKPMTYMHRFIAKRMGIVADFIDHIDGDPLNNRRSNLRGCTRSENNRNKRKKGNCTSRYKGVSRYQYKGKCRWQSQIQFEHRVIHLGRFHDEIEAAKAYDVAARKYFKEFAKPNFP